VSARFRMALRGDLRAAAEADLRVGKRAVTSVVRRKTNLVKPNIRKEIQGAGLGPKLAKTIQGVSNPRRGASFEASGVVFSKAFVKGRGSSSSRQKAVDLVTVFTEGTTIRARRGRYLAVPVPDAGGQIRRSPGSRRKGSPAMSPEEFASVGVPLLFLDNPPRLVSRAKPTEVFFWLVTQVRIRPRIDPASEFDRAMANFDQLIARKWERDSQRAFDRLK